MKRLYTFLATLAVFTAANAQIGAPYIHDPSTLAECDGKWYTFGTGGGGIISDDGWSWHSGAERPGGGAAPDMMKIGDRYLCIYGATGGGLFGGHNGRILTMWNKTLDPKSPDFKWSTAVEVASSDGMEDCDAIDPCLLLDPTTGRLWATYGTYFGNIRLIELDPKTGERVKGNVEKDVAIDCEASALMYRDGWYYLLGTHGTCCDGVNSTYNIVVGRSRSVEGPYVDNVGRDMFHGGGRMVIAAGDRATGAGHFGSTVIDEGVEVMSFHWEADFDMGGRSVRAVRPFVLCCGRMAGLMPVNASVVVRLPLSQSAVATRWRWQSTSYVCSRSVNAGIIATRCSSLRSLFPTRNWRMSLAHGLQQMYLLVFVAVTICSALISCGLSHRLKRLAAI